MRTNRACFAFALMLFSAVVAGKEDPIKYSFNHETKTLTFYDVLPTKREIEAVAYQELTQRFLACNDVFVKYKVKLEREKLLYEYDQEKDTHTLTDCDTGDITKLTRLPYPFNVLYFPKGRTMLSPDEVKFLAPRRIAFTCALESMKDAELAVQRKMYQDILKELEVDSGASFYYTDFILKRWYIEKGITQETFLQLSALNKCLHFPDLATCSSDNPFKLTEEEKKALWQLQKDRIVFGQASADVALIGTLACPWIHPVVGTTYVTKRVIKIGQCYSKTYSQYLYKDYKIDDDIIIEFRKSEYDDANKFYKDMSWWNWFKLTVQWGIEF